MNLMQLISLILFLWLTASHDAYSLQVFIITDHAHVIHIHPDDRIGTLRKKIKRKLKIKGDHFYLVMNGGILRGKKRLRHFQIRENSNIMVMFTLDHFLEYESWDQHQAPSSKNPCCKKHRAR